MAIRRTYRTDSSLRRFFSRPGSATFPSSSRGIATAPFARSSTYAVIAGARSSSNARATARRLQCHYHGWTYNLDGSLRTAPRESEQKSFPKQSLSLLRFTVETWGPLIFVNPSPDAGRLHDLIGELAPIFARAGVDLAQLRMLRQDTTQLAANWKIVVENFNECYHCPIRASQIF